MSRRFANRAEAGHALARRLAATPREGRVVVLALPRGGVPIGAEVARELDAPLDLLLVRKIGAPWQPELAVAAIVDGDPPDIVIDEETSAMTGVDRHYIETQARLELQEIERRRSVYLAGRAPVPVRGATVIVVDDGIATGTTVRAAPVAPSDTLAELSKEVDEIVCLEQPYPFRAIGLHYVDFHQVGDDEVLAELEAAHARQPGAPTPARRRAAEG
jgi:putative phosphoribosyl transferase